MHCCPHTRIRQDFASRLADKGSVKAETQVYQTCGIRVRRNFAFSTSFSWSVGSWINAKSFYPLQNVATDFSVLDRSVFINIRAPPQLQIGLQLARHLLKVSPSLNRKFTFELEVDENCGAKMSHWARCCRTALLALGDLTSIRPNAKEKTLKSCWKTLFHPFY